LNRKPWTADVPTAAADKEIVVAGWVVDKRAHNAPLNLYLRLKSGPGVEVDVPVRHRPWRADLVAILNPNVSLIAGFTVTVPPGKLAPGIWRLSLVYRVDDREFICDNLLAVDVTPPRRLR
jgi:hypothetical protein